MEAVHSAIERVAALIETGGANMREMPTRSQYHVPSSRRILLAKSASIGAISFGSSPKRNS